jgi:hypothetical protein
MMADSHEPAHFTVLSVGVFAMANADDENDNLLFIDLVQHAVIANANAKHPIFAFDFLAAGRMLILGKVVDCFPNPYDSRARQPL